MTLRRLPLFVAVCGACGAIAGIPEFGPVRVVPGVALALFLPGYALSLLLFPTGGLDTVRRTALALALSGAITVIGGAIGGAFHILSPWTWALWLVVTASLFFTLSEWRSGLPAGDPRGGAAASRGLVGWPWAPAVIMSVAVIISCGVLGFSIAISRVPASVPADRGYTTLSIAPVSGGSFRLDVACFETAPTSFMLEVWITGRRPQHQTIRMYPGAHYTSSITPPPGRGLIRVRLLSGPSHDHPYRRVRIAYPALPVAPIAPPPIAS